VVIPLQSVVSEFAKAFVRNYDGSWTCVAPATLDNNLTRRVQVALGTRFVRGQKFMNIDLAGLLDEEAIGGA
jgi:hypothetical protein